MRIAFTTLGCKINQFESDVIRQDLQSRGNTIVPFDEEADVYIINTCTVTAKTDTQCRNAIRAATLRNSKASVVVTGCYAETRPEEIRNIPGVNLVFGNRDKDVIVDHIMSAASPATGKSMAAADAVRHMTVHSKTRGFLKIQDGCDNRCTYCIVPLARGNSRSAAPLDVLREFERLVRSGRTEVVLTGIHIGTYGSDIEKGLTLTEMVRRLLEAREGTRLRLSSIEPREVTDELIGFLGKGMCRHLHIPLQSGDDAILASMKRNYTADYYLNLIEKISKQVPGAALGADVMVGFPGEGEKEFQNTMRLIEQSPLTHLHVFSYSPRPGTLAAEMKHQVSAQQKRERSAAIRSLGLKKNMDFRQKNLGSELFVVVEDKADVNSGLFTGLTDNYIRVQLLGSHTGHIGKKLKICIKEVKKDSNFACIL